MPIVICSWYEYVGQGTTETEMWSDAEEHEKTCDYNEERELPKDWDNRGSSK